MTRDGTAEGGRARTLAPRARWSGSGGAEAAEGGVGLVARRLRSPFSRPEEPGAHRRREATERSCHGGAPEFRAGTTPTLTTYSTLQLL